MAHSDLIIIAFEQKEDALLARKALEIMRDRHMFGLEHAAEITCDETGRAALHHHWVPAVHPHGTRRHLALMLSRAMFDIDSDGQRVRLAEAGLDEFFLEEVMQALAPNSSALMIYVPNNSSANTHTLLKTLALFQGTLHRTTISPEAERLLFSDAI
jgi:uncharacterized membrane protein